MGLGERSPPMAGEKIVCLCNDDANGIMNGEVVTVERDYVEGRPLYIEGGRAIDDFHFSIVERETNPKPGMYAPGYALTVHKSQGSEWDKVLLIDTYNHPDRCRWLYSAITRAAKKIRIVNGGAR